MFIHINILAKVVNIPDSTNYFTHRFSELLNHDYAIGNINAQESS